MVCTHCGVSNSRDSKFCKSCGREMPVHSPPPEAIERIERGVEAAFQQFHDGRDDEAMASVSDVLQTEPDNVSALSLKAMVHERRGQIPEAIAEYERVISLNPESVTDRLKLESLRHPGVTPPPTTQAAPSPKSALLPALGSALVVLVVGLLCFVVFLVANLDRDARSRSRGQTVTQAPTEPQRAVADQSPDPSASPSRERNPAEDLAATQDRPSALGAVAAPAPSRTEAVQPVTVDPRLISDQAGKGALNGPPATVIAKRPTPKPSGLVMPDPAGKSSSAGGTAAQESSAVSDAGDAAQAGRKSNPVYDIRVTGNGQRTGGTVSPESEASALLRVGRDYYLAGNYRQAIAAYGKALPLTRDKAKIYQQMGTCYRYMNDSANAIAYFDRAIAAYQQTVGQGGDTAEANQGIRTCRSTIALLRGEASR